MPAIGEPAPTFSLPDTDGVERQPGGAPATVVIFTCNHCPYALAWHERTVDIARDYASRGVRVLAINPNDSERYPRDSPEAMRERVQAGEFDGVPYLHDESQDVAHAYDAKTTPDVFVLDADAVLRYRGAPDGDYEDPSQNASYLRDALDAVLAGDAPALAETEPIGCSIKWKPDD
ncbi:MAG TPA: thioredoxin family protein [Solirubrobacteraceae bacterium]|nr:thioredoxin family protein [Solirubrobacteraceae bacterium]